MSVLVEVVHAVKPLTNTVFDRWIEWYGNDVIPAMSRNGYDVLGAFKRSSGPMGEDVLISRFESLEAYSQAGVSLRKDPAFLKSLAANAGQFTVVESVKAATFVPYATEARLERALAERPAKPRQYMQAVLQVRQGRQAVAYEAIGKLADLAEGGERLRLVTAYETSIGRRGELTDLWVYPGGMGDLSYRPGDPLADLIAGLREAAPEETISFLNPLPYSRLQ
jgi:hypothetical protein